MVLSWTSLLVHGGEWATRFLITAIPSVAMNPASAEVLYQWLDWSLECLLEGKWSEPQFGSWASHRRPRTGQARLLKSEASDRVSWSGIAGQSTEDGWGVVDTTAAHSWPSRGHWRHEVAQGGPRLQQVLRPHQHVGGLKIAKGMH